MCGMTRHGSAEHFSQVVSAHVVGPWGNCRCGAHVGTTADQYRAHIGLVWQPYALPEGWGA